MLNATLPPVYLPAPPPLHQSTPEKSPTPGEPDHFSQLNGPAWTGLAIFGNSVIFISGILRLMMPVINRQARPIAQGIVQELAKFNFRVNAQKLTSFLASRDAVQKAMKRFFLFGLFFQGINMYQIGFNARQPLLVMQALLRDTLSIIGLFFPTNFIFSLNTLASTMEVMGNRNDIENNNHPEQVRDWNLNRLFRFLRSDKPGDSSLSQEMKSLFDFLMGDLRQNFSLTPWRQLRKNFDQLENWQTPQGYQISLSAQLFATSWLVNLLGIGWKKKKLNSIASISTLLGSFLCNIPLLMRAWQNRTDIDGKLVLIGTPLALLGSMFQPQFTQRWFFLNGFSGLGGPLALRGLSLNSKHYRALVDTIDALRIQAEQNPRLTASVILKYVRDNPEQLEHLQKRVGKNRTQYFIKLLQEAEQARRLQGLSLAAYLASRSIPKDF